MSVIYGVRLTMKSPRRGRDSLLRICAGQTNGGVAIGWAKSRGLPTAGPKKLKIIFQLQWAKLITDFALLIAQKCIRRPGPLGELERSIPQTLEA